MTHRPDPPLAAADVVLRFLESVGRRSEFEFYLALFRKEPRERFAVILVEDSVARHAAEAVVLHLRFLHQLGLVPVVVFGTFDPRGAVGHARHIERRLVQSSAAAETLRAEETTAEAVARQCQAGTIPLIAVGAMASPLEWVAALVRALETRKLLFLHRPGGLRQRGALIPIVNLTTDLPALLASPEVTESERAIVDSARRLVDAIAPRRLLVAITSPLNLLRELFTTKGAGTMLRAGATITRVHSYDALDRDRLGALLTSAFGRPPAPGFFDRPIAEVHVADGYRGAAIMLDTPLGTYLSKFAVDPEAQGEGLGRDLWDAFAPAHPRIFWRARAQNPIVEWYTKLCDGFMRSGPWIVFWRGLSVTDIPAAITHALDQPVDIPPATERTN